MTLLLPAGDPPVKLSERLRLLRRQTEAGPVRFEELLSHLQGNAYVLLLILLALPFVTPLPLPGLSTPFGVAIAAIAARLCLGRKPWLPEALRGREIPRGFFGRVLAVSTRIVSWLESFLRPRWGWLFSRRLFVSLHAALVFCAALLLLLPLPIPFSNMFPAWVVLFVAGGLLERDGLSIMLGYAAAVVCAAYFVFLGGAAQHLFRLWASGGSHETLIGG